MRATLLLPLILLTLLPFASAGTAEDPDLTDPAGDASPPAANAWADATAAWVEPTQAGARFVIQLARLDAIPPGTGYLAIYDVNNSSYYAGLVSFPPFNDAFYVWGSWDRESDFPGEEGEEISGELTTGAPATIALDVPVGYLKNGTSIDALSLRILDYKATFAGGMGFVMLDTADGGRSVALGAAAPAPEDAPGDDAPAPVPALSALAAAGAVAAVALLARRRA